tara:strand:+ start:1676 stop:1972 length:297 start_codon:yes stop_codon:yes gene_type:complete
MPRDLYYARIPYDNAKAINWDEVMENSWDTARWDTEQTEVMVHWVGETPTSISKILGAIKSEPQTHTKEYDYIKKSEEGKSKWEVRPIAPPKPKEKKK